MTSVSLVFILPGYPLSATRSRVDCRRINAGVVTLGESLRLVVAGGLIDPKLFYELSYDAMLQLEHIKTARVAWTYLTESIVTVIFLVEYSQQNRLVLGGGCCVIGSSLKQRQNRSSGRWRMMPHACRKKKNL